nr:hypothetical protein Q903MT_gene958 [Picea sitchensis]
MNEGNSEGNSDESIPIRWQGQKTIQPTQRQELIDGDESKGNHHREGNPHREGNH